MAAFDNIDGFAVYHMCFRHSADRNHLKWLDFRSLAAALLPDEEISKVRYCTARVGDSPENPQRASRQDAYLRTLAAVPGLEICQGNFVKSRREVRLVSPPAGVDPRQTAWVRQKKRSDVTLATHLLTDAFDGQMPVALLMTNDSDFVEPIRIVRERFGVRLIAISPDDRVSKRLAKAASFARPLDYRLLEACQLPDVVVDADGREIFRPPAWTRREET